MARSEMVANTATQRKDPFRPVELDYHKGKHSNSTAKLNNCPPYSLPPAYLVNFSSFATSHNSGITASSTLNFSSSNNRKEERTDVKLSWSYTIVNGDQNLSFFIPNSSSESFPEPRILIQIIINYHISRMFGRKFRTDLMFLSGRLYAIAWSCHKLEYLNNSNRTEISRSCLKRASDLMRVELERSSVANNQNSALSQIHLDPNTSIASQSPTQARKIFFAGQQYDRDVASQPSSPVLEPEKDKKIPYR
ncbi:hypothetical protein GLOIN_2v1777142 [Rhizophagus clarus]|uniref:Uncharacterized protein n=1 Tax=Rhizophagus clarus TaxID=94130 RepID=A0A8H3LNL4_9GLOM|nr:hypothetical protein GLOIN_2v1777142 [Rhizophagus clarus]